MDFLLSVLQNRSLARSSQNTEAEILSLKTKLREAADTHKEALAAAVEAGERALKERNALANALAYLSQKAVRTSHEHVIAFIGRRGHTQGCSKDFIQGLLAIYKD